MWQGARQGAARWPFYANTATRITGWQFFCSRARLAGVGRTLKPSEQEN